jgi:Fe2+ transport system protein B
MIAKHTDIKDAMLVYRKVLRKPYFDFFRLQILIINPKEKTKRKSLISSIKPLITHRMIGTNIFMIILIQVFINHNLFGLLFAHLLKVQQFYLSLLL